MEILPAVLDCTCMDGRNPRILFQNKFCWRITVSYPGCLTKSATRRHSRTHLVSSNHEKVFRIRFPSRVLGQKPVLFSLPPLVLLITALQNNCCVFYLGSRKTENVLQIFNKKCLHTAWRAFLCHLLTQKYTVPNFKFRSFTRNCAS